jgi:L-asparaginase
MPLIAVATLGGTISMAPVPGESGAVPRLGAADLLGGLGDLPMDVLAETLAGIGSASLDFATLLRCREWGLRQDADGFVVVQGTDTLEETAYFLELTWPSDVPVVVTGAMRNAGLLSPDGPANLRNALTVAADPRSRGRGVLVTLNDDVHAARWVRKAHSSHLEAFSSAPAGPLGMVVEHAVHWFHPSPPRLPALAGTDFRGWSRWSKPVWATRGRCSRTRPRSRTCAGSWPRRPVWVTCPPARPTCSRGWSPTCRWSWLRGRAPARRCGRRTASTARSRA